MKVQNNTYMESYIEDYQFNREDIRLKINVKLGKTLEYRKGKYAVILKNKTNEKQMILEVKSVDLTRGKFGILVELNISKYIEIFKNQVVDVYVLDRENNIESRVTAKKIKEDIKVYYSVKDRKFIQMYKEDKVYLSIREKDCGKDIYVESAKVNDSGILTIEGVINCAKMNSLGRCTNLIKVRIKDKEDKKVVDVDVSTFGVDKLIKDMEYTGIDYSSCGFRSNINLLDSGLIGGIVNGRIYLVLGEDEVEVKLKQPKVRVSGVKIIKLNGVPSWLLKITGKKNLNFTLEDISKDIEFKELHIKNREVELRLSKEVSNIDLSDKNIRMILKSQNNDLEYNVKCRVIANEEISIVAFFDEFASKKCIELDTYDIYLRVNGEDRKVVSRYNHIMNNDENLEFDDMHLIDKKKNALVLKSYYTEKSSIAIGVKNMMEIQEVQSVGIDTKGINIKGLMYIRKPLENECDEFTGVLNLNLNYGVKAKLSYTTKTKCIDANKMQYSFKMHISKEELKKGKYNINYIVKNMSDKIISCSVNSTPENRSFVFEVKAANIKLTLEDRIKEQPIGNKIIDSISKPIYNICNVLLPIDNKLIVFQSYNGKSSYSCDPKAIYEEIIKMDKKYKYVWVVDDIYKDIPGLPKVVKPGSLLCYYYMARAKYLVSNTNSPEFYKKRKGVVSIETGVGTPLKKLDMDISKEYEAYEKVEDKKVLIKSNEWDTTIVPNKYARETLTRVYSYENEILDLGSPRNDVFYKNPQKRAAEVRKKLNIPDGKKVIMYAPTFRENSVGSYKIPFSINEFDNTLGKDYVLLLRLHYKDANRLSDINYSENIKNVSLYDDIADLYLVSDLLITDYSSVMFDYANSKKPMLFYAYDLEEYKDKLRGLYFDFEKMAPGPIVKNEKELFDTIKNMDTISKRYKEKYSEVTKKFCAMDDGEASKRVVEEIFKEKVAD